MNNEILEVALKEYGHKEISGNQHSEHVLKYFHEIGHEQILDDETAWCAAFANWVLKQCGYEVSGQLNARSFLNVGKKTNNPEVGDIVVLWRQSPDSWKGHVGFFIKKPYDYIWMLGGNQQDEVNISPYDEGKLLEYRKPCKL